MIKIDEMVERIIIEKNQMIETLLDTTFREKFGESLTSKNAPMVEHEIWHESPRRHVYKYKGTPFLVLTEGSPSFKEASEIATFTLKWKIEKP